MTSPRTDDSTADQTRYRCLDYSTYYAGNDFQVFESWVGNVRQVLPAISEPLLKACDRFRTLDEHAQAICQLEPFRAVAPEAVCELLAGLVSAGLLISHQEIAARTQRQVGEHGRTTISTVGILTFNRPEALRRVVSTTAQNVIRHGRQAQFVIMDDSDAKHQAANLAVLHDLIDQFGIDVWYAGPTEKAAFARDLAEHCDVPLATVNVALTHRQEWPATPGANRNALLLQAVGEALLSLDDDMVCQIARLPEGDDGLALTSAMDLTQFWFYPDRETTLRMMPLVDEDVLGLHESLLGCNVGRLAAERSRAAPLDLDTIAGHFLKNLEPDGGRVTLTMAGIFGDSGMGDSVPLFYSQEPSLSRLLRVEGGHRAAMASRQVARGVLRRTVSNADHCMGGNLGLDNRSVLPPFQTVARNEDGVFAALVRHCIDGSFVGFLPRAMLHDPIEPRQFSIESFDSLVGELGTPEAMLDLIGSHPDPVGRSTTRRRLVETGQYLMELGALAPAEMEDRLREIWLRSCSSDATIVEKSLRQYQPTQPESWAADLRLFQEALFARMGLDQPVTLLEHEHGPPERARALFQTYLRDFGGLLRVWPDLVEGARELRHQGRRLARRLVPRA